MVSILPIKSEVQDRESAGDAICGGTSMCTGERERTSRHCHPGNASFQSWLALFPFPVWVTSFVIEKFVSGQVVVMLLCNMQEPSTLR